MRLNRYGSRCSPAQDDILTERKNSRSRQGLSPFPLGDDSNLGVLLAVGGGRPDLWQHFIGEQIDRAHYLVVRRGVELHEQHDFIHSRVFQDLQGVDAAGRVADTGAPKLDYVLNRNLIDLLESPLQSFR